MSARFLWRGPGVEIARARRIAEVLIRNGLGFLAEMLGLTRLVPPWRARQTDAQMTALSIPLRVRRTLEELGPTYIKFGQILSTRPDILPPELVHELGKLLDAAPPVPFEQISETVEHELGQPLAQLFATFDPTPIASASIGQVHRATLPGGIAVIVKVQRPGVARTIQADLNLLSSQARFLEGRSSALRTYGLLEVVEEFSRAMRDELDYVVEGRNADRLRKVTAGDDVLIPTVYWERTTRRVITLQDLEGIKLNELDLLVARGYDLASLAARLVQVYSRQVFVHGVFHADPHAANILVCDQQIGLVDFGVVGYLTPRLKDQLGELLFALVQQDADQLVHVVAGMGATGAASDRQALKRDIQRLVARYYSASLETLPIADLLGEMMGLAFRHHVRMPPDLALLARTVVVLEGVALSLDPTFVLARFLEPFMLQLIKERLSLKRTLVEGVTTLRDLQAILSVLPRRVETLTGQLERGEMTLGIDVRHLIQAMRKLDAIGNRLSFSIVVAAIIVGSAMAMLAGKEAALFRIPFTSIGLPIPQIGFVTAGLLGAWLLFSIVRSKGL